MKCSRMNLISLVLLMAFCGLLYPYKLQKYAVAPNRLENYIRGPHRRNGLLFLPTTAVGFVENSCLSRNDPLLRHSRVRDPSPYLLMKLRGYEAMHRRCGPYTASYNRTVSYLGPDNGTVSGGPNECRYIIWKSASGMGNKMMTLASTFLYALLTDRVLLISHDNDIPDLFCEPFPESTWLLPLDFPLSSRIAKDLGKNSEDKLGNMIRRKRDLSKQPYVYLHMAHDYDDKDQLFFCDREQSHLRRVPWLVTKSDNYFIPSLFLMHSFQPELELLFPDKELVFHQLGRYLFLPTNPVWGLVVRYYEAYLSMADVRVGIQIRNYHARVNGAIVRYVIKLDQILSCSHRKGILPRISEQGDDGLRTGEKTKNRTLVSVMITSLGRAYSEELRNMYWEKPTSNGETVAVYQPSFEELQKYEQKNHDMKAVAEMYLLSLCDKLVTTSRSTFGYVAQALGGLRPWIVFHNETAEPAACSWGKSMEPCFHDPPPLDAVCKARTDGGGRRRRFLGKCDG
ncbi:hypothetical protein M569_15224, partial [Genlisea aurea]